MGSKDKTVKVVTISSLFPRLIQEGSLYLGSNATTRQQCLFSCEYVCKEIFRRQVF